MAISTEIQRLQSAKAALKTAINAKNDSNHQIDDETLDDYAGFVDLIHDALPAAYTELEYIESSGTQYIDTNYYPNSDDLFEMKIRFNADTAQQRVFCSRINDGKKMIFEVYANGSKNFACNITTNSETNRAFSPTVAVATGVDYVLNRTGNFTYSLNGTSYSVLSYTYTSTDYTEPLHLFGGSYIVSLGGKNFNGRFYYFKVPNKIHLVPAKRNSDNAIGMYDKVSGTFFTNAGTGEFIAPEGSGGGSATLVTKTITANGTYDAEDDSADGYSEVTVNVQPPQEAPSKDVNFYDYDGKILYSYTASEFQALTALPENPTHTGWTSKGWNWTLADAKTQVTNTGKCDIGQMYRVTDGKTRLYCNFKEEMLSFYFTLFPKGTVTIDWGDGSATDDLTGTSRSTAKYVEHTYASAGDYVITLSVSSGDSFSIAGGSNGSYLFRKDVITTQYLFLANAACLKKVELGEGVYLGNYAFAYCSNLEYVLLPDNVNSSIGTYTFSYSYGLKHVTIPTQITSLTNYMFRGTYAMKTISIPKEVTTMGSNTFYYAYSLQRLVLPPSVTTFGGSGTLYGAYSLRELVLPTSLTAIPTTTTYRNYSLTKLVVPSGVTTIATKAFQDCHGMKEYHFKSTTVPTLDNADAFSNIQSDCKIYVPSAKLTNYQTAQNWSSYSSQMVGE